MISHSDDIVLNVPSFVAKLWHILNNKALENVVTWQKEGSSFVIKDKEKFAVHVLPRYFKHNNLSSFIRQLNKYGFKKVPALGKKKDIEFAHSYFLRDDPKLLLNITKKLPECKTLQPLHSDDAIKDLLLKVQSMKKTQDIFESKLNIVENRSNELWKETLALKKKQKIQEKIINNIMGFLANLLAQNEKDISNIPLIFVNNQPNGSNNIKAISEKPHVSEEQNDNGSSVQESELSQCIGDKDNTETSEVSEVIDPLSPSVIQTLLNETGKSGASEEDSIDNPFSSSSNSGMSSSSSTPDLSGLDSKSLIETTNPNDNCAVSSPSEQPIIVEAYVNENNELVIPSDVITLQTPATNENDSNTNIFTIVKHENIQEHTKENTKVPGQSIAQVQLPSKAGNEQFGDHINMMDSKLNDLKELLSDADLNLDIDEVMDLFSATDLVPVNTTNDCTKELSDDFQTKYPNIIVPSELILPEILSDNEVLNSVTNDSNYT